VSATQLWPKPHSRLFDFDATSQGAEWIDEIAARARQRMLPAGVRVITHSDWRQEHVRFIGNEPVTAFDWDSLCCDFEPALLGFVAHAFCADWSRDTRAQAPTLQEALAFISDYEKVRGSALSVEERGCHTRASCTPAQTRHVAAMRQISIFAQRRAPSSISCGLMAHLCFKSSIFRFPQHQT
jgi:hypothetical protein